MLALDATSEALWDTLHETRERTLLLVDGLTDEQLQRIVTPLLSPLVWDLGHIANFEQRWLLGESSTIDGVYNPFENPRAGRGELPLLPPEECFAYMAAVRERVRERLDECDPFNVELVIGHEQQHNETMLQLLRMIDDYAPAWRQRAQDSLGDDAPTSCGPDEPGYWVDLPAGEYEIGTSPDDGAFAYDNECCRHRVTLATARIARRPVTNAEFLRWMDDGGYDRTEWWSPAGREWLAATGASAPLGWERDGDGAWHEQSGGLREPLRPDAPVVHVSWFEAAAFARAHGARLPTEQEWEVAATFEPDSGGRRLNPWGDRAWRTGDAVLDQLSFGTTELGAAAGARPSPLGCEQMLGQVWEWTASEFAAYPGFEPFRYREYSAPFFDGRYRVLRGGSWATRPRTVTARFRNWDFPQRRQIFAGLRLARDA
jgi:iron(II)-dependent oxidoreductase